MSEKCLARVIGRCGGTCERIRRPAGAGGTGVASAAIRKSVDGSRPFSIERVTREELSPERRDLQERIATCKVEALRRIEDLPWYALQKDEWHRDVECVTPTSPSAPQDLAEIAARVKRSRTLADRESAAAARAVSSKAQQTQLTAALLLIEIQLDKLIELSREWQSA